MNLDRYKFRARKLDNGGWVYGSLINLGELSYIEDADFGDVDDLDYGRGLIEIDPSTVGQWSGQTDKEGVDIYEGDIVGNGTTRTAEVYFSRDFFGFDTRVASVSGKDGGLSMKSLNRFASVEGNIHDP